MAQTAWVGPTAREHLAASGSWLLHSVFARGANLVRLGAGPSGAPPMLHLSARPEPLAGKGSLAVPFGVELDGATWGRWRRALRAIPGSARWRFDAAQGTLLAPGAAGIALPLLPGRPSGAAAPGAVPSAAGSSGAAPASPSAPGAPPADELVEALAAAEGDEQTGCAAAAAGILRGDAAPARELIGRGIGLTPSGDDALVGMMALAPASAPAHRAVAEVAELIRTRGRRLTTDVSCAYLVDASRHRFAGPLQAVLDARPGPELDRALEGLLAVGHSSGADTLQGLRSMARARRRAA
ncbi:DUF2877 domain-containing protein [Brachybacterium hainanense]|uniref:DUF2877 domain-containing protein n=1 Tax=Brachybacterium hainanense TaxID=1541174 RepID=A0ABV6RA90_9MICO